MKPVSVSAKSTPCRCAIVDSNDDDTIDAARVPAETVVRSSQAPEQRTDLVASEHPPARPVGQRDGDRAPVGVRVVGQHEVSVLDDRRLEREVERAGLLRVGERHRRKVRIRLGLHRHDTRR